ncbi:hypothetical protein [Actinomadura napierensis]|uniref:DUF222 domain-containing protein n=1 Tax=Actinomadura napierensis TaxID=267854 RepID=A0ABN2YBY6_9ACTN
MIARKRGNETGGAFGERTAVVLGARLAEVEALFAAALTAPTEPEERATFAELGRAAARLAASAASAAGCRAEVIRPSRPAARKMRLQRRMLHAQRTTDQIIARCRPGG